MKRRSRAWPRLLGALVVLAVLTLAGCKLPPPPPGSVRIAAAGDIASQSCCGADVTANLIAGRGYSAVLALGDNQYESGTLAEYTGSYDRTWGRFKSITYPVPGNHEYQSSNALGYYAYFWPAAHWPNGYYSYDLGRWHIVALNSEIPASAGSAQDVWFRSDLAAHRNACTLVYAHRPRYSRGQHGDNANMDALWRAAQAAHVDVWLGGHDHNYQRWAPLSGLREFVVGTGGASRYALSSDPLLQASNANTFGILDLVLSPTSYSWRFVPQAGKTYSDSGTTNCT